MDIRDSVGTVDVQLMSTLAVHFPKFASILDPEVSGPYNVAYHPATEEQIEESERSVGVPLPISYKHFLRISRGLSAFGGGLTVEGDPWYHTWPPTEGMLCFADYCREADGDQALFDVSNGLVDGEYPVYYYSHEVPRVYKAAESFKEFLEHFVVEHGQ